MPYTHPQDIRDFKTVVSDEKLYLVSGGGEGTIRTWQFDQTKMAFDMVSCMEGHLRKVTCMLLKGEHWRPTERSACSLMCVDVNRWFSLERFDGSICESVEYPVEQLRGHPSCAPRRHYLLGDGAANERNPCNGWVGVIA